MEDIKIIKDYSFNEIVDFFIENELEWGEDDKDEVKTDFVCSFTAFNEHKLIGAVVLAKRENEYICDGIAVKDSYRKLGLGELLLNMICDEAREIEKIKDGEKLFLYLVARAPDFFSKQNFIEIVSKDKSVPNFFECKNCPQREKTCFPKIMKKDITKKEEFCEHNCDSEKEPDETISEIKKNLFND